MTSGVKKTLLSSITVISVSILAFSVFSCSNTTIYLPNRQWQFIIKNSNNPEIDTVTLKSYDETWKLTQKKIEYIYNLKKNPSGNYSQDIEITGVIDRKSNVLSKFFLSSEIWLHPPRTGKLRVTELLPFPWVKLPVTAGQSNSWELTPKEGWKEMEGKKITGKIKVVSKIFYDNPVVRDTCWLLEGIAESEFGKNKCIYYFHEIFGFVYFLYDFNDYQIELIPIKIVMKF